MSWVPTTDFEEEIVESQPYHNFIYGKLSDPNAQTFYPRPKQHLDFAQQQKKEKHLQEQKFTPRQNHKLDLIAKIQRIAGTKPLGEQPTVEDWDTNENLVRETIALMRHVGFNPGVEEGIDEERTIATHPITEEVKINRNGRKHMPIFFAEKFFELKPRVTLSPPASPTLEQGEGNGLEQFNESIGSSCTSAGSNSMSQATSSSGTPSRNSISDYCKAPEFNNSIEYHMKKENGRTTRTANKTLHSDRATHSSPKKQHQTSRATNSSPKKQHHTDRATPQSSPRTTNIDRAQLSNCSNKTSRRDSSSPTNSSSNSSNNFSSRGSSSLKSTDKFKDRSSNTANSGFESAIDHVNDEDSFETAHNSLHEYQRTQRKSTSTQDKSKTTPHKTDQVIKTQSWRNTNMQADNNYHIQSNWRAPNDYRRKEQKPHKIKTTLCTPKELYDKKRHSTQ